MVLIATSQETETIWIPSEAIVQRKFLTRIFFPVSLLCYFSKFSTMFESGIDQASKSKFP